MKDRTLMATGAIGAGLALLCCATPVLVVSLGAVGLSAWLANADFVLLPALLLFVGLLGIGLYRRRTAATRGETGCCDGITDDKAASR